MYLTLWIASGSTRLTVPQRFFSKWSLGVIRESPVQILGSMPSSFVGLVKECCKDELLWIVYLIEKFSTIRYILQPVLTRNSDFHQNSIPTGNVDYWSFIVLFPLLHTASDWFDPAVDIAGIDL